MRILAALLVIALALCGAFVPLPRGEVERLYSDGAYLVIQPLLTSASNRVSLALLDVLLVTVPSAWLVMTGLDLASRRHGLSRTLGRILLRTIAGVAALYLIFLGLWGLNYRRVPLAQKLQFNAGAVSSAGAQTLANVAAGELNRLHADVHKQGWAPEGQTDEALVGAFERAQRDLGARAFAVPGRPKRTLLNPYLRRAGVDGLTDPYFLETLMARDLLPFERPFVVAHEWGHLAGFADEGEANFVGWLTCVRGSPGDRYSGWIFLFSELTRALPSRDRSAVLSRLADGPRADLAAISDRLRRQVTPAIANMGWQVYDRYLKANRVEAGAASYAEVVRLALGARFGPDWTPLIAR